MTVSQSPRLAVVSLQAGDVHTSVHFYRDVIGLKLLPHHEPHQAFELPNGIYFVIIQGQPKPELMSSEQRFPVLAFAVDDLETTINNLKSHDVALPWGVEERSGDRWVKFYDPAGNLIEIVQFSDSAER
jgi:catechol 2,3-dioxygenase-like lactoylglutathione lyase family enzyme